VSKEDLIEHNIKQRF